MRKKAISINADAEKRIFIAKQRRTLDERIQSCTTKEEEMLEKLKQYQAQRKQLEKRKKEEERKIRIHRLIQIGGAVESVLSRPVTEEDVPKLIAFLKKQESNGKYFSRAMQTKHVSNTVKSTDEGELIDSQRLSIPLCGRALWRGECVKKF